MDFEENQSINIITADLLNKLTKKNDELYIELSQSINIKTAAASILDKNDVN